jgi:hypothetical protein
MMLPQHLRKGEPAQAGSSGWGAARQRFPHLFLEHFADSLIPIGREKQMGRKGIGEKTSLVPLRLLFFSKSITRIQQQVIHLPVLDSA